MKKAEIPIYKNIYIKVISICVIGLFIIMGMVHLNNISATRAIQKEYIASLDGSFTFHAKILEQEISNAITSLDVMLVDDNVRRYLYNYNVVSTYEKNDLVKNVKVSFSQFISVNNIMSDMGLITSDRKRGVSYRSENINFESFPDKIKGVLFAYDGRMFILRSEKKKAKPDVIIYAEIKPDFFDKLSESIKKIVPGAELAIVQGDNVFFKTHRFPFGKSAISDMTVKMASDKAGRYVSYNGCALFKYPVFQNSVSLFLEFEEATIFNSMSSLKLFNWLVICFIAIFTAVLVLYIYYALNRPMKKLVRLMSEVEKGNLSVNVPPNNHDQFGYIFTGFQNMLISLNEYIRKNYDQLLELKRSEFKQLQSQINPHFLYNCFFNISNLCKVEDSETAMVFSQRLATYYMYITRSVRDDAMFKDEYQHAKDYLDIQCLRFHDRVDTEIAPLTQEQERFRVPRIILQPILENCYKYVFDNCEETGKLRIHTEYADGFLRIIIEDSGVGLTDQTIDELNQKLEIRSFEIESTGIINVNRRLHLKNDENGVSVKRSNLGGMLVELKIAVT